MGTHIRDRDLQKIYKTEKRYRNVRRPTSWLHIGLEEVHTTQEPKMSRRPLLFSLSNS